MGKNIKGKEIGRGLCQRTSEMICLTWNAIDWKKRNLTVNKALEYRHKQGNWRAGPPKAPASYRTFPLTIEPMRC